MTRERDNEFFGTIYKQDGTVYDLTPKGVIITQPDSVPLEQVSTKSAEGPSDPVL